MSQICTKVDMWAGILRTASGIGCWVGTWKWSLKDPAQPLSSVRQPSLCKTRYVHACLHRQFHTHDWFTSLASLVACRSRIESAYRRIACLTSQSHVACCMCVACLWADGIEFIRMYRAHKHVAISICGTQSVVHIDRVAWPSDMASMCMLDSETTVNFACILLC